MSDSSDPSGRPAPGPFTLLLRAAFVPDGEQPPAEFLADFNPLKFRATLDRTTGIITCVNAGINFGGDISAEWHKDEGQDPDGGKEFAGRGGALNAPSGPDEATPDKQRDQTWGTSSRSAVDAGRARPEDRPPFGLAGQGPNDDPAGTAPASPEARHPGSTGWTGQGSAVFPWRPDGSTAPGAKLYDEPESGSIPSADAGRKVRLPGVPDFDDDAAAAFGALELARAAGDRGTNAGAAVDDRITRPDRIGGGSQPMTAAPSVGSGPLRSNGRSG